MLTLNVENRDMGLKPKQLRRKGIIPAVLYGNNLENPLSIQLTQVEATRFLKSNSAGSKAELLLGGKRFPALLREIAYQPVTDALEHLSFQTLLAGEIVTSMAKVVLVNREKVAGVIHQPQSEISYRALPSYLVDKIEIDLDGMKVDDSIRISDLDVAKNPNIEILSPLDAVVLSITDARKPQETSETEDEDA
ncbi:50S ribosomal protein L25 [Bacillota bacterium Meth-B3]